METSIPQKTCARCKKQSPATSDYFTPHKGWKDGFYPYCKQCKRELRNASYWKGRERPVKPSFPDMLTCRKCGISKPANTENFGAQADCRFGLKKTCKVCEYTFNQKPWVESHRDILNQRNNSRYPSRKSYFTSRYEAERERILATQHAFEEEHPEIVREWKRKYAQTERGHEISRAREHRRRTRKRDIPGNHTPEDIQAQFKRQKGKCYYCHKKLVKFDVDHVIPLSREGSSNDPWNLVVSCPSCNRKKRDKLPSEWPEGGRLL